ncbi:acyl--CoA ligase [Candidatus Gottesmanbacteria bacterium]|nr:acyl--CoA ligase [Candidatus Gottesmanbacteria bacterium]
MVNIVSVEELLSAHAKSRKDAIVAVDPDTNDSFIISYSHLVILAKRTASYLAALGIRKGDRFAILMHNAPEVLIFELAGALLGATTVPLDFKRDTLDRKIFKLQDTGSKALFVKLENGGVSDIPQLPTLYVSSWSTLRQFQSMLPKSAPLPTKGDLNDHYVILYTSGTTARPKGVLLSQRACLLNAMGIVDWQKFTSDDRFNIVLPLHHINSTEFCLSMLLVGGTIILNSRYSTSKFWHIVKKFRATNTSIVPTILHDLLVRRDEFINVPTLKRICIGSAPVLPEETLRFYETFKIRVVQGYGQTETALRVAGVPVDVGTDAYKTSVTSNTIGTELANNHLAIMDERNNEKKEGEHGEICINGPILADGYLNNPDETKKSFIDGWFHSGDLGYWKWINGKKFFFIIGRIKEIIIKGGVNISPSAIEDALLKAYPQIDEVSIVGYPDERMGEEIAAVIVSKKEFSLSTVPGLSLYETPKKIFFVKSLPKTSTGKIQRVEVKKQIAQLLKKEIQKHYYVRRIQSSETEILARAVAINNERWLGLPSTLKEFRSRTINGLLYGAFEEKDGLVGSLSCVRVSHPEKLKTWNEASANGTLANYDLNGDTLLCVAISVKGPKSTHIPEVHVNPKQYIEEYVRSSNDHVLEFHRKPKGGLRGATVWKILENGRSDDKESMGYNVLMKYPEIKKGTKIVRSAASSPSVLLIEHALLYAKDHGIKNVIAFSRPAGFRKYLMDKVVSRSDL